MLGAPARGKQAGYANGAVGELLYEDGTYTTTLPDEGRFAWSTGWSVAGPGSTAAPAGGWQADPGYIHVHGAQGSLRIFHYANLMFHRTRDFVRQVRLADRPMPDDFALQLEALVRTIESGAPTRGAGGGLEAVRTLLGV